MYEVELKVPADLPSVRDRIAELDGEPQGTVVQEDTYYDAPHRSFAETDEALRIRRERADEAGEPAIDPGTDERTRVTYKGPLVEADSKTREEVETGVGDAAAFDAILSNLGFRAAATVRKERERYRIDGYTIVLDDVDGVGQYVEVETEAVEEDVEAAREGAVELLERLGLDPATQVRTSYLELSLQE